MFLTTDEIFYEREKRLKPLSFIKDEKDLLKQNYNEAKGLIVRLGFNVDRSVLSKLPQLELVATITTGLNHIDHDECLSRGITVVSLKEEVEFLKSIRATPELTWALLLTLMRNVDRAINSVRQDRWERELFYGRELSGKTLGIYGLGRVGNIVKGYAEAFGMKVIASDIVEKEEGVRFVTPEELFQLSDVISIHLPLEKNTVGLVDKKLLSEMKRSAVLINTSRGELINEEDLLYSLLNQEIAGAAVDVLAGEIDFNGSCSESPMVQYAKLNTNLVITPHIAGSTYESMERTADFIGGKVYEFFN